MVKQTEKNNGIQVYFRNPLTPLNRALLLPRLIETDQVPKEWVGKFTWLSSRKVKRTGVFEEVTSFVLA